MLGLALGTWYVLRADPLKGAQVAFDRRDFRMSFRAAQDLLKRSPQDQRAALIAARSLTRLGLGRQAEEFYRRAGLVELEDQQDRAYGLVLAGQPEQAAEIYFEIIQKHPEDVLALKRLAAVLIELKQWKHVLFLAERLIQTPEGEVAGHTLAGIGFHVTKHAVDAANSFEKVLQLDPNLEQMPLPQALFWNHLALDLIALGRGRDARTHLEHALAQREDPGLRELLGVTYEKEGLLDQAEHSWRQALSEDPNQADALLDLGRLSLVRRQWDEAVSLLEQAEKISPDSVELAYNLGRAYRFKGELSKAVQYEARAAELRRARSPAGGMGELPARLDQSARDLTDPGSVR